MLALAVLSRHRGCMALPTEPVSLSVQQIEELTRKLSNLRHDINGDLALVVAAAESLAALPASAFRLTKAQFREPSLQRMGAGATIDAAVQDVWASDATLAAIRDYVARTFKKPSP
jgi:hypothetical protein